jgi:tetratricopeptide (TPR) repeat protein
MAESATRQELTVMQELTRIEIIGRSEKMKVRLKRLALLALLSCISLPVYSRPDDSNAKRKSDQSKDASVRNESLRRFANEDGKKEDHDGAYWFGRGFTLHQADNYIEAIQAFSHSISLGYRQATSMYNVACGYALLNDKDNALFWLERSLAVGFDRADLLKVDSDLDPLRSDPRFKEIVRKVSLTKREDKPAKDKTVSRLEKSLDAGFDVRGYISGDEELDSLRSDPRFKRFLDMADDQHKEKHKSDK